MNKIQTKNIFPIKFLFFSRDEVRFLLEVTEDSVIGHRNTRAFACAFKIPWEVIATEQWAFAILNGRAMVCEKVIGMIAERHDYIRMKQPKWWDGTKCDPAEFCEICDNAGCKDPIVLHLSRHLVTIKRGGEGHYKVFDTWNSSHYSKVGYYYVSTHDEKKLLRLLP